MDYSNLEWETANNVWKNLCASSRMDYLGKNIPKSAAKLSLSTVMNRYETQDLVCQLCE
jgi:hypothetical protein